MVAVSRPYLGVHYPTDVLAGFPRDAALVEHRRGRVLSLPVAAGKTSQRNVYRDAAATRFAAQVALLDAPEVFTRASGVLYTASKKAL